MDTLTAAKNSRCSLGVNISNKISCCGQTPVMERIALISFGSLENALKK